MNAFIQGDVLTHAGSVAYLIKEPVTFPAKSKKYVAVGACDSSRQFSKMNSMCRLNAGSCGRKTEVDDCEDSHE